MALSATRSGSPGPASTRPGISATACPSCSAASHGPTTRFGAVPDLLLAAGMGLGRPAIVAAHPAAVHPRTPRRPDLVRASDPGALPAALPEESAARELTSGFDIQDDRWELTGLAAREPNLSRPHGVRLAGTDSSLLSRPSHIPDRTSGDAIADASQDRPSSSAMTSRGPPERGRLAAVCRPLAGR